MKYKAISADGHVNEPPNLWVDRLPAKFKDRGPHVIETRGSGAHAWIVTEGDRPLPLGRNSVYYRNQKVLDDPTKF